MKKDFTELVFILDKSGSMSGLETDTIGGYNAMLGKQRDVEGECRVTTVLFAQAYELLHDRIDIRALKPISDKEYQVGGSTALLDAMGMAIDKMIRVQKSSADAFRAEKVMFVIITDGEENSSREYSLGKIKEQIERQKKEYGWEFIFLGANIDAVRTAGAFGIASDRAFDYLADGAGTALNFRVLESALCSFRNGGKLEDACFAPIVQDVKRRRGARN